MSFQRGAGYSWYPGDGSGPLPAGDARPGQAGPGQGWSQYPAPAGGYIRPRPRLENGAVALLLTGAVLIGAGVIIFGTAPGDIRIGPGSYEGGYNSEYSSGYYSGYWDGENDRSDSNYHGYYYEARYYSGERLRGYNAGYEDGFHSRANVMEARGYIPAIKIGAVQAASVLAGAGVILEGLGASIRIRAHFDQVKYALRI